jgi:Protein of unknown function (DUF2892)
MRRSSAPLMLCFEIGVRSSVMSTNIGTLDRALRLVLGGTLISFALLAKETPYSYLGWIGVIPILTALVSFCPLYSVLGVRTNQGK